MWGMISCAHALFCDSVFYSNVLKLFSFVLFLDFWQAAGNGLTYIYNDTKISLPAEVFWSNRPMVVVNVVYLTLNDILQLSPGKVSLVTKLNTMSKNKVKSNTTIVSSTIRPPLRKPLNTPVRIVLQNKEVRHFLLRNKLYQLRL